jgi:hypothetical protein
VSDESTEACGRAEWTKSVGEGGTLQSGDSVLNPLGFFASSPIPELHYFHRWGSVSLPNPNLVLAPESALRVLTSRALSSAPAACSVSGIVVFEQRTKKKQFDGRGAFRHVAYRGGFRGSNFDRPPRGHLKNSSSIVPPGSAWGILTERAISITSSP